MLRHISIPLICGEITFPVLHGRFRLGVFKRDDKCEAKALYPTPLPRPRSPIAALWRCTRLFRGSGLTEIVVQSPGPDSPPRLKPSEHPAHHDRHETNFIFPHSTGFDSAAEIRTRESEQAPRVSDARDSASASRLRRAVRMRNGKNGGGSPISPEIRISSAST